MASPSVLVASVLEHERLGRDAWRNDFDGCDFTFSTRYRIRWRVRLIVPRPDAAEVTVIVFDHDGVEQARASFLGDVPHAAVIAFLAALV